MPVKHTDKPYMPQWEINISITRNPLLWFQLVMVSLLSSSFLLFLLVGLNLYEHHWDDIPSSFLVAGVMAGGLFIAFSLIGLLMYGRGIPTRYVLKDKHIEQHTLSRGKKTLGLLGLFGLLSGKNAGYTATGAALLAHSREAIAINWNEVTKLETFPERHEILLHNNWRTIMQVVCPVDQFDSILKIIQEKTQNVQTDKKLEKNNQETPFAFKLMLSFLAIIFGIFLIPRLPIHFVGIFAIAAIIFALLSLWSSGVKRQVFAGILVIIPILGVSLAFIAGEIDMHQSGAIYALAIEVILLAFFLFLGLGIFLKFIK